MFDPLTLSLARWQFAITAIYHFFFVPLTLGLSILVALMETIYMSAPVTRTIRSWPSSGVSFLL